MHMGKIFKARWPYKNHFTLYLGCDWKACVARKAPARQDASMNAPGFTNADELAVAKNVVVRTAAE